MPKKQTNLVLSEEVRKALAELGDGSMSLGVRRALREAGPVLDDEDKPTLVLPEEPSRAKIYEKLLESSRRLSENTKVMDSEVAISVTSSTLGLNKASAKNVLRDLEDNGFIDVEPGSYNSRCVIHEKFEEPDHAEKD